MTLFQLTLTLFLIMDPIGNIMPIVKLTSRYDTKNRRLVIFREMCFALFAMFIFYFIGEFLLQTLKLSDASVYLTAGLILFLTAVRILYPDNRGMRENLPDDEPFISPIAVPLIAGPSLTATIMLFAHLVESNEKLVYAMLISWVLSLCILLFSKRCLKIFGENGLLAMERLMAMILVLLSIQRFFEGITLVIGQIQG